jgi:hypothetical protein
VQDERQAILLCILKVITDLLRKREVLYAPGDVPLANMIGAKGMTAPPCAGHKKAPVRERSVLRMRARGAGELSRERSRRLAQRSHEKARHGFPPGLWFDS